MAAAATSQFVVTKEVRSGRTFTQLREVGGKAVIDFPRHRGSRIDQDGVTLRAPRQEQRRRQRIAVGGRYSDVVGKNVVLRSVRHGAFPQRLVYKGFEF